VKLKFYLAGAMEKAENLGAGWRDDMTAKLDILGHEVLNPCLFEPRQLKGLHTKRLPESFTNKLNGELVKPTHWHQLKLAKEQHLQDRFLKYMRHIIKFDIKILLGEADVVVCLWSEDTGKGAGTHAELTYAYLNNIPVYTVMTHEMPAWALACCTKTFDSFEELNSFLSNEYDVKFE